MKKNPLTGQLTKNVHIWDNITGKRLSPKAVRMARCEELGFIHNLAVLKEVPVEQCWMATNAKNFRKKWSDITRADGDRVEFRSRLVATELMVHQLKMSILRDDGCLQRHTTRRKPCDS